MQKHNIIYKNLAYYVLNKHSLSSLRKQGPSVYELIFHCWFPAYAGMTWICESLLKKFLLLAYTGMTHVIGADIFAKSIYFLLI
ncbi:hypothetical protein UABAM_00554 [Candidatus Uabimicrobium amorphum]|uniref:Uncharacterized protein n=1 Tax=Uabimicrobium amorphum TaxID=2596890 RepID=A0A5S9IIW3_UABAM|nr:hypothetical protein UABAM_00554 [Candidatus Uabimicrobium amorphum]